MVPITLTINSCGKGYRCDEVKDLGMIFWIILGGLKCNHKSPHHESAYKREAEEGLTAVKGKAAWPQKQR